MKDKKNLCKTIEQIYPDLGKCSVDYNVDYDDKAEAYSVDIHDKRYHLKTFVDEEDARFCLDRNNCLSLGLELGQLKSNFEKYKQEHALEAV